jgi:hypothetical protein
MSVLRDCLNNLKLCDNLIEIRPKGRAYEKWNIKFNSLLIFFN